MMLRLLQNSSMEKGGSEDVSPSPEELTADMVAGYFQMVEWLLDTRLTIVQRARLKSVLSRYFQTGDQKKIQRVKNALAEHADLKKDPQEKRRERQVGNIGRLLEQLEEEIKTGDAEAAMLKNIYYANHPILFQTEPPLTHEIADTWLALDRFLRTERVKQLAKQRRKDRSIASPSLARKKQILLERWKGMSIKERYRFYRVPGEVKELLRRWPKMTDRARNTLIDDLIYGHFLLLNESREQF